MKKQFGLIGLGKFGRRVLEEMLLTDVEILIIDKDEELIEQYKNRVEAAYVADALKEEAIAKIVPATIDAVVIDLVDKIEVSILVTNYLKKHGVRQIIATAETDEHGEILELVGATQIIFPNKEAARRITPTLISATLFNYFPIGSGLAMAEVEVPAKYHSKTVIDANLRQKAQVNVIAIRSHDGDHFGFFGPDYLFQPGDVLLIVGEEHSVNLFTGTPDHAPPQRTQSSPTGQANGVTKVKAGAAEAREGGVRAATSAAQAGGDKRRSLSGFSIRARIRQLFGP